jgi:hypothetical protein
MSHTTAVHTNLQTILEADVSICVVLLQILVALCSKRAAGSRVAPKRKETQGVNVIRFYVMQKA